MSVGCMCGFVSRCECVCYVCMCVCLGFSPVADFEQASGMMERAALYATDKGC